jgi:hypothetical protein
MRTTKLYYYGGVKIFLIRKKLNHVKSYESDHAATIATLEKVKTIPEAANMVSEFDAII